MNVWIIDHYSSEPQYNGISRQYDFACGLSERGINVLVIASSFSHFTHEYNMEGELTVSEINHKAHYAYVRTLPYQNNSGWRRGFGSTLSFVHKVLRNAPALVKEFGKPDVVVGCSIHPFTWIAAQKIAKKNNAKFFAEVRDLWPQSWVENRGVSRNNPRVILFGALEKWAYRKADKIIYSMSRGDKYICDVLGFPREKVIWIDQPMYREKFDQNALRYSELPEDLRNFIGESFLCVFTGFYKDYEGVFAMLEAAKILKDKPIKFVFLGTGDAKPGMIEYKHANLLENVYIGDRISKELIPALLRRAQACLVQLAIKGNRNSYKYDASKNKINEYMYSDSVIIYGTYIKDHNIEKCGAGFCIEPFNGEAFADSIMRVFNMTDEERKFFGDNARKYVIENNSLERLTERYVRLLNS